MNTPQTHIANDQLAYSPSSLLNAFSNSLTSPLLNKPLLVKGIYKKGKGVNYNGVYYDILKDEYADSNITLVLPEIIRLELKEGQAIEANAYLTKRLATATGRMDIILTVSDLLSRKEKQINEEDVKALELIRQKAKAGYKDVDGLIRNKLFQQKVVSISILIGATAIIDNDIKHQLKDAIVAFDIKYIKINLSRTSDIVQALKGNDNCDILVISRGGGENIQIFDNLEIAQQALRLKSAFVTAIGHAVDEPLLQKIADKHFITPTALGQYFHDIYSRTLEELNNSKAKLIADLTKQIELSFQSQIQHLNSRVVTTEKAMADVQKENREKLVDLTERLTKSAYTNKILVAAIVLVVIALVLVYLFK